MERRFDMSDFEQSLKDHADQFKMIPSKRVWNGIYNNLHPGSKWPSITVAIVFLITLITIGTLNNSSVRSNGTSPSNSAPANNIVNPENDGAGTAIISQNANSSISSSVSPENPSGNISEKNVSASQSSLAKKSSTALSIKSNYSSELPASQIKSQEEASAKKNVSVNNNDEDNGVLSTSPVRLAVNEQISQISFSKESPRNESEIQLSPLSPAQAQLIFNDDVVVPVSYKLVSYPGAANPVLSPGVSYVNYIDPVVVQNSLLSENAAATSMKTRKKKNNSIEWTFYVNPTISTVAFNKKTIQPADNTSSLVVLSSQPSFKLTHTARFGVETGAEMSLKIAKKFKFITGFNMSYLGYNNVSNLVHPTFAILNLNDGKGGTDSKTYITHYGNGQSQDHINLVNYNIQASIPLGIQYNIWGSPKISIDIASTFEPSLVLRDDAYLISSDGRYYVEDPMLVRRTNIDGHLGSYITFIGKKIKWHLGPDFRYQMFSTYKNIYPTKEHLINYGIRIGISK